MAVILQRIVGVRHGDRFYPDFAGVARSYNFYPAAADDGRGRHRRRRARPGPDGRRGGALPPLLSARPAPGPSLLLRERGPRDVPADVLGARPRPRATTPTSTREARFGLAEAEADGTLAAVGSTFSAENDAVYDGVSRPGMRVVSFAPILKHDAFPLAPLLSALLKIGSDGGNAPVEIEFAVNLSGPRRLSRGVRVPPDAPARAVPRARGARPLRDRERRPPLPDAAGAREREDRGREGPRRRGSAPLRARAEPRGGPGGRAPERAPSPARDALSPHRRRALGLPRPVARNPGRVGADLGRARDRRGGPPGDQGRALAGEPFLPEPRLLRRRLLHRGLRGHGRLRRLGVALRAEGRVGVGRRAAPRVRRAAPREGERTRSTRASSSSPGAGR